MPSLMGSSENVAMPDVSTDDRDLALVQRYLAGEERTFNELVARYQTYVYNICLQMLGNASDAEDAAQDVFLGVYKSLPRFRMQSRVSTWIYRITVNQCISRRRSRRAEVPAEHELGEQTDELNALEERRVVRQMLQKLAPHYRIVLVLRYYHQLTYDEIAEILGWSVAKVKCYLHRARNMFRRIYEKESGGEP